MIQPRIDKTPPSSSAKMSTTISSSVKMSTTMTCFFFTSFLVAAVLGENLFYIFLFSLRLCDFVLLLLLYILFILILDQFNSRWITTHNTSPLLFPLKLTCCLRNDTAWSYSFILVLWMYSISFLKGLYLLEMTQCITNFAWWENCEFYPTFAYSIQFNSIIYLASNYWIHKALI